MFGNACSPNEPARAQPLAERSGQTIAGGGENDAKAQASSLQPIDLLERDLLFAERPLSCFGNASLLHARGIACPALRREQPQADGNGNLPTRKGEGNQRLAVGPLAQRGRILRGDANRAVALLGQARVVDDQKRARGADELVCLPRPAPSGASSHTPSEMK